jgi:hypothetical protein
LRRLYNFVNKSLSRPEAKGKPLVDCRKGYAEFRDAYENVLVQRELEKAALAVN